jgi:hypothetical protein
MKLKDAWNNNVDVPVKWLGFIQRDWEIKKWSVVLIEGKMVVIPKNEFNKNQIAK